MCVWALGGADGFDVDDDHCDYDDDLQLRDHDATPGARGANCVMG